MTDQQTPNDGLRVALHSHTIDCTEFGADALRAIIHARSDTVPDALLGLKKWDLTDIADAAERLATAARKVRDEGLVCRRCNGEPPRGFTCNTCQKPCANYYTVLETETR